MNLNLSSLIALALLAVAVTLTVVSAESCYECNSITNSYCENLENTAKVEIKKCDEGVKFCRKIVQTVMGEKSIIRQCAASSYKDNYEGCFATPGSSATHKICECRQNGDAEPCNVGFKLSSPSILAIAVPVAMTVAAIFY